MPVKNKQSFSSNNDVDVLTRSVLDVLAQRKETKLIPQVGEALKQIASRKKNQNLGVVWSVVALPVHEIARIKKIMQRQIKREIQLKNQLDSSLLGGFRVEIGDWVLDASLKADFANLQKALL